MFPTFLILGGYGNAGRPIADLLLKESHAEIIISGRNLNRAENITKALNNKYPDNRVRALQVDAKDPDQLKKALKGANMVIVASSTVAFTKTVAMAAIESGLDYMDIQLSKEKIKILQSLEDKIIKAGLCFITDGGYHPGIPAALVRYAATRFDIIHEAVVGAIMNINWQGYQFSDETIKEFTDELKGGAPLVYKDDEWAKAKWGGMFDTIKMDFGDPYGKNDLFPIFLEEMRNLPVKFPELKKTGFYIGGMDWFSNWISFPLATFWFQIFPKSEASWLSNITSWGMKKFSKPPFYTRIKLESKGISSGKPFEYNIILTHPDGYMFTAIPVVACLNQYIDGKINKPGLFTQGGIVEPTRFIRDIERMGIQLEEKILA